MKTLEDLCRISNILASKEKLGEQAKNAIK